jgi:hypothetical protein
VRLGLVRPDGGPAVTRIVVEGVLHVAVVAVLLLVRGEVRDGRIQCDITDERVAPRPDLCLEVGQQELAVLAAAQSAAGAPVVETYGPLGVVFPCDALYAVLRALS